MWDGNALLILCTLYVLVVVDELFLGVCLDCGSETVPFGLCYVGLVLIPL